MPTGPLGVERPFTSGELIYVARYNVSEGIGVKMEDSEVRSEAERMMAQRIEQMTSIQEPGVDIQPAGFVVSTHVSTEGMDITDNGVDGVEFDNLKKAVDDSFKEAVDTNARRGKAIDMPGWEIQCK
jgi:hypothetical protein